MKIPKFKPPVCPWCNKPQSKQGWNVYLEHGEWEDPFECVECGKYFKGAAVITFITKKSKDDAF